MVHEGWIRKDYVRWWLEENPSVKKWLTEVVTKPNTQYDYGYNLMRFCEGVGESPERLREIRLSKDKAALAEFRRKHDIPTEARPDEDGSYVILDLLKKFIRSGRLVDLSPHKLGGEIEVAKLSKSKRHGLYAAVRAYFRSEKVRAALPDEAFKIDAGSRVRTIKDFSMEGNEGIEQAKRIILSTKEPYRTLFWGALYGCMGDSELCTLNNQWPEIRGQIQRGKDPVRVSFASRKGNELPYYTFVPARVFQPYVARGGTPFINARRETRGGNGAIGGNPVNEGNLIKRWREGRTRANVGIAVGVHNMRDLWRTYAVKAGLESSSAEFLMGHSPTAIDPNRYNQIYNDPEFVRGQWEKMRKLIDGESESWRKDIEELKQRLDKTEYERREDLRRANREFLIALRLSPKQIKRIEEQHSGDLANLTREDKGKIAEQVKARFGLLKPAAGAKDKPPTRLRVPKEEAEQLQEKGWEKIEVFDSGNVLLEWRYATPPPRRPSQAPSR